MNVYSESSLFIQGQIIDLLYKTCLEGFYLRTNFDSDQNVSNPVNGALHIPLLFWLKQVVIEASSR